jgi:phosphatidylserine/phosphatidylglycerophosphate/cardiolipin synthase-like enzyme
MSRKNKKVVWISSFVFGFLVFALSPAMASERLCDASFEDCRAPLVALIQKENVEIDIAFWFMDDWMITNALNAKIQSGVKVRMLVDPRSDGAHSEIPPSFATLGTPMRQRIANGILHWKMAIFAGQGVVEFSGANMSRAELDPYYPYSDYVDEAIFFSDDPNIVNSFRTMYDKWWVDTVDYSNFANTAPPFTLTPAYAPPGPYPIESEVCAVVPDGCGLNFLPSSRWQDNYGTKVEYAIGAEKTKIDVDMFRITNAAIANSMIAAFQRGVPIRMIVDMSEYTNTARVWDRYNVDRMFMVGIPLKITKHTGQNHEKSVLIYGQGLAIWGSSNWTSPSFNSQQEHNYFSTSTVKPWYFQWFVNQFERRWNSPQEYQAFVPQPPSMPVNQSPANAATGQSQSVTLRWDGGPWGQQYDIYVGAGAVPTLIASNVVTGAPDPPPNHALGSFQLSGLAPNTTYRWRIVSKTMANLATGGQTWTFTTAGTAPTSGATVTSLSPATGSYTGGTTAQIYGTNFESGATVNFGLAAASKVVFVSPTQLTVTTPPGPQVTAPSGAPVSVTVTNPDHTSGSLASGFVYAATPVPPLRLNVVVPNTGSAQGGTLMTISGSNFASGMTVTVGGSPATVTSTGSNSIQATAPAGNPGTPADIVVTNPKNGQSATLKAAFSYTSSSAPVTLSAISPTSGSSNGGNRVVISGSGLQYGAVVSFGGPPPLYPLNGSGTLATTMAVSYSSDPQVCGTAASLPCMIANTPAFPSAATASVTTDVWVTNMNPATGLIDSGSASAKLTAAYTFVPAPLISVVSPSSGSVSGGSQITITGKYFQSGATVLVCKQQPTPPVCTQAAVVNPISSTSITAVVPANAAGTAAVSVVNPNQEQSNILIFTYQ